MERCRVELEWQVELAIRCQRLVVKSAELEPCEARETEADLVESVH